MRTKSQLIIGVVAAVLIALFMTGGTTAQKSKEKEKAPDRTITTLELTISKDGRSIVDQNGKIIAVFVEDMKVQMPAQGVEADTQAERQKMEGAKAAGQADSQRVQGVTASLKIKGCLRCVNECLIYDSNGVCVKWYRSCTWDFDC